MQWINQLQGQIVGLDTAPLIYFVEENQTYLQMVDPFFEALGRGEFTVVTSAVTLHRSASPTPPTRRYNTCSTILRYPFQSGRFDYD